MLVFIYIIVKCGICSVDDCKSRILGNLPFYSPQQKVVTAYQRLKTQESLNPGIRNFRTRFAQSELNSILCCEL